MKIQTMMKTTNKILQYYKTNSPRFRQIEYIKIVNIFYVLSIDFINNNILLLIKNMI